MLNRRPIISDKDASCGRRFRRQEEPSSFAESAAQVLDGIQSFRNSGRQTRDVRQLKSQSLFDGFSLTVESSFVLLMGARGVLGEMNSL